MILRLSVELAVEKLSDTKMAKCNARNADTHLQGGSMIKCFCDRCGNVANGAYADAEVGESAKSIPATVDLVEGINKDNYNSLGEKYEKSLELCTPCFEILKDIVRKFLARESKHET